MKGRREEEGGRGDKGQEGRRIKGGRMWGRKEGGPDGEER